MGLKENDPGFSFAHIQTWLELENRLSNQKKNFNAGIYLAERWLNV